MRASMVLCVLHFFLVGLSFVCGRSLPGGQTAGFGSANGAPQLEGQAALQDAVEGIGGLMQRFEQLQGQLGGLARADLDGIANQGQHLHRRFLELQERMASAGGGLPAAEETPIIGFHRDLALFVAGVEAKLGIMGPVPHPQTAQDRPSNGMPSSFGQPQLSSHRGSPDASAGNIMQSTNDRLQAAMQSIADGMQRFDVVHPKLQNLPRHVFGDIARRGQKLHEDFLVLQRKGMELSGQGGQTADMNQAAALPYAAQLEAFVEEQAAFVKDAEALVQSGGSLGGGLPPVGGMPGLGQGAMASNQPQMSPPGGAAFGTFGQGPGTSGSGGAFATAPSSFGGGAPAFTGTPPSMGGGGFGSPPQADGGRVTPATDQRLSAAVTKVVSQMEEFQALKNHLTRLPQQVFSRVAQQAQELNERYSNLQRRGAAIAGDGSVTMSEIDGSSFASEMEAFHSVLHPFVEETKQTVQSGGSGLGNANPGLMGVSAPGLGAAPAFGSFGGPSLASGGSGFGGANFPAAGGSFGQGAFGSAGTNGLGGIRPAEQSAGLGSPSLGAGGFGGSALGAPSFGGSRLGANSFGGPSASNTGSTGFGVPPLGGTGLGRGSGLGEAAGSILGSRR